MNLNCSPCKILLEHADAKCFIVDVGKDPEHVCEKHQPAKGEEVKLCKDYLELNRWAGNLSAGVHFYKITG